MNYPLRTAVRVFLASGMVLAASSLHAQMKIGDKPYSINKASVLELESDRQGLLLPRVQPGMLTAAPLNAAPDGMIVIVENATKQDQVLYLRKNGAWVKLATLDESSSNWSRSGNTVNDATDFLGSNNAAALIFKTNGAEAFRVDATGNVGIGNMTPTEKFDLTGNAKISGDALIAGAISAATANISGAATLGSASVTGATSTGSLTVTGNVTMSGLAASTMVDVLVINPATGAVTRRAMSPAAFENAISELNGSQEAVQSFATATTGTDFGITTTAGVHTFSIPTAGTGITRGLLTEADWLKLQDTQKQLLVGAFSATSDAKGFTIGGTDNNELVLHAADDTNPGAVSTAAQTFAGAKTFNDKVTANAGLEVTGATKLTGAAEITGAVTLGSVAATAATGPYQMLIQGFGNVVEKRSVDLAALENGVNRITSGANSTVGPDVDFSVTKDNNDFGITVDGTAKTVKFNLPDANGVTGATARGAVSTTAQSFAGDKSFAASVGVGGTTVANSTLQVAGSVSMAIKTVNSAYTITDKDNTVLVDATTAGVSITLPAAVEGRIYTIKKIGTGGIDNEVVINPAGTAKIEGGSDFTIYNDWTFITLQSNGTDWFIIRK